MIEVNIDFKVVQDNIFQTSKVRPDLDPVDYEALQISSVCATMNEFPFVQFMGNNEHCRDLAKQVLNNFE